MCDLRWTRHGWRMRLWQAEGRSATRRDSRPRLSKRVQLAKGRHHVCSEGLHGEAAVHPFPPLTLTRGARHLLPGGRSLVLLRGEIQHKNLWLIDLETGAERQLTNLTPDFDIRDFDISADGREVVFERVQERSDVALLDLPRR